MKKLVYFSALALSVLIVLFAYSCEKDMHKKSTEKETQERDVSYYSDLTLEEFKATLDEHDLEVVNDLKEIDNTSYYLNVVQKANEQASAAADITFKWHTKRGGCVIPLGICLIIRFEQGDSGLDGILTRITRVNENKVFIEFPDDVEENFGLTSNGLLPLPTGIYIPDDMVAELNLLKNRLEPGVYTANYDKESGRYTGVIVDLY